MEHRSVRAQAGGGGAAAAAARPWQVGAAVERGLVTPCGDGTAEQATARLAQEGAARTFAMPPTHEA